MPLGIALVSVENGQVREQARRDAGIFPRAGKYSPPPIGRNPRDVNMPQRDCG